MGDVAHDLLGNAEDSLAEASGMPRKLTLELTLCWKVVCIFL